MSLKNLVISGIILLVILFFTVINVEKKPAQSGSSDPITEPLDASKDYNRTIDEGELTEEQKSNIEKENGENGPDVTGTEQGPQF